MGKFKFRQKPVEPHRQLIQRVVILLDSYSDSTSVEAVAQVLKGIPLDARVRLAYDSYDSYSSPEVEITWMEPETDIEFGAKMEAYKTELTNYLTWETHNKENIAEYLQKKENKKQKEKESKVKNLNQQIKKLTKQLEEEKSKN